MEPWENELAATKEKTPCIQFNHNIKKGYRMGTFGVEDCLYLDIFTPAVDEAKRAVIMFIYNEHFSCSYNKSIDYQPDFFIEEDVIVVTISHRLSAFGFLSLEDETLWGNGGLKDLVMGLEWVKNNIEKFGGDPERITLQGVRGGAAAVDLLVHSKKKDLFKSAILHSGNSWKSAYLQENVRERAFELARLMKKNPVTSAEVIKDLVNSPAKNLTIKDIHASPPDYFKETQRSVISFAPIVEKDPEGLIVDYPENSNEINTPILMGFNSLEGLESSFNYLIEPRYISFLKKDFHFLFPIRVNFVFDPLYEPFYDAIEEIKEFYFKKGININTVTDYVTYIGDALVAYAVDYAARRYAKISKSPLYYYHFDYYSDLNENKNNIMKLSTVDKIGWGAASGDELCYLFKCPDLKEMYLKHDKEESEERNVQRKLVKMWTNFAKYG